MRADEVHHEDFEGESRERTGGRHAAGRHAAPRRPLFTRLQMPAGKAIALAAMPTAVLMGMGLTPTLAQAKPLPKNPFQDGPCVTQPDESPDDAEKDGKAGDKDGKTGKAGDSTGKDTSDEAGDGKSGGASATPAPSDSATPSGTPGSPSSDGAGTDPAPSPSASSSSKDSDGGLLGDLGGALGSVLSPGRHESAAPQSSPSPSAGSATGSGKDSGSVVDKVAGTAEDTVGKVADTAEHVTDGVKDAAGKAVEPSSSADNPLAPDASGKDAYPCVVEKKSAGEDETPPVPIPNQPWNLQASSLLLKGLDYKGVVNLTMPNGRTKQALKFTTDGGVDIGDLHQTVAGPDGKTYHVQAAPGSTSTIRGGQVTMYTERLSGNLFGVIPIVFDPEHPPPLNVPVALFTHVNIVQAGQFGGNLTVPGLHQYLTG
ncbi:hypothetical protein GCM10018793_36690 [Streptomyces sulfonofaciens]|uniref:Hydrogenase expression protein HypF n=1 Tax=Streptomyces sulfonofaciens TaxID=68272 RepID=A0A919GA12_9ACTN|nr:hypothetical protein [Streptomyces sulfonofaciens]GHH80768.1 hypothetical protein GCM10018793_36690 [Streptomyces sulfonofaciens]